MEKAVNTPEAANLLRQKAEELLKKRPAKSFAQQSEAQILKLIHEIEVHQIELEMQNEELVLAKEKAELAAEKHTELYDFAPSGYVSLTKDGKIIELNLRGAQMLGKERLHLANKTLAHFVSEGTKTKYNNFLAKLFKSQIKESCEVELLDNNNPMGPVLLTGIASEYGNQCFVTMVDISERKRAEEERLKIMQQLQKQKLESLGLLAGGIAHDFNNLMGGIYGYIDIAREETKENKVTSYLSKAMNTIDRARAFTQQLLTFAKGGAPIKQIGDLFPFVQEIAQFALSGSNVSCHFDVPQDLWACDFDKNQIGQVINNLILNAQQAMPVGGMIELTARNITPAEKEHPSLKKDNYVKISVKDCGIGIRKELVSKIFDPFFTTKPMGHGLGLATCYSIINRHGGCIDVDSEPGKGTTCHVYLPASMESVSTAAKKSEKTHRGSGNFLIMDDEEVMRDTICTMLESFGYTVVCKENGKEAVDFTIAETNENRTISGMIFDLTVPGGMGGKEAIEEIKKLNKDIPAFVASGYTDDLVMKNPTEYGFMASIRKPFRISEISEILNKFMKPKNKNKH